MAKLAIRVLSLTTVSAMARKWWSNNNPPYHWFAELLDHRAVHCVANHPMVGGEAGRVLARHDQ